MYFSMETAYIGTKQRIIISNKSKTSSKKKSIYEVLIVFLIIYISDSLLFATSSIAFFRFISRLLPLLLASLLILKYKLIHRTVVFLCISIMMSLALHLSLDTAAFYITQIGCFLFAYFICKEISFESFAKYFLRIMRVIAVFSIIGFVFTKQISQLSFLPTVTTTAGYSFKVLIFTNVPIDYDLNITNLGSRNWGPFWEPGTFQFYLNIAIIFSLFSKNKLWLFDFLLFSATLLTTMSGASFLAMPFIVFAFIMHSDKEKNKYKWLLVLAGIVIVFILFSFPRFSAIIDKFSGNGEQSSLYIRAASMFGNLIAGLTHPLFGSSLDFQKNIRTEMVLNLGSPILYSGNVNTVFGYFAFYGVFVGVIICWLLYKTTKAFSSSLFEGVLLFLAIFIASSNENLMQSVLFCVLIFMGMNYFNQSSNQKRRMTLHDIPKNI